MLNFSDLYRACVITKITWYVFRQRYSTKWIISAEVLQQWLQIPVRNIEGTNKVDAI